MLTTIKTNLEARRTDARADSGDLVQTVLLVAGFALAAILVVTWISTAILNKGVDAAKCIEASNTYTSSTTDAETACSASTADTHSFQNDNGYKSRYGTTAP